MTAKLRALVLACAAIASAAAAQPPAVTAQPITLGESYTVPSQVMGGQRTINVVDDTVLPMGEYLDMVARWAGLPLPPRVDRETLRATVTPMRASFMSESRRLSNLRMKRELRLPLRYPTVADFLASHQPPDPAAGADTPARPI